MGEFDHRAELGLLSVSGVSVIATWPNGGIFGAVNGETSGVDAASGRRPETPLSHPWFLEIVEGFAWARDR